MFIHDAVLESLSCGDTQIVAKELVKAMKLLEQTDEHTGKTGYDKQFQVQQTVEVISVDNKVLVRYWDKYPLKITKLSGQQLSNIQTKTGAQISYHVRLHDYMLHVTCATTCSGQMEVLSSAPNA